MVKIFATGVTGYVGGDALYLLLQSDPELESSITCMVRSTESGQRLTAAYPKIKTVSGTLDDSDVLEAEAAKADIVLHYASCDHVGAALAIKKGMEKRSGGIWIHTSGNDILLPLGIEAHKGKAGVWGEGKVYDDWEGIKDCLAFPKANSHGPVDEIVRTTFSSKIKTAIICPPTIWGVSRGTGSTRSHQIYNLASIILSRGEGLRIPVAKIDPNASENDLFWPNIHVYDLSPIYVQIIQDAISELAGRKGKTTWNEEGYYFAVTGKHYWQKVADDITKEGFKQGFLKSESKPDCTEDDLKPVGVALWNSKYDCKAIRATKLFGWKPESTYRMEDEIPDIVKSEAKRLGLEKRT